MRSPGPLLALLLVLPSPIWAKTIHKPRAKTTQRHKPPVSKGRTSRGLSTPRTSTAPTPLATSPAEKLPGLAAPILLAPTVTDRPTVEGEPGESGKGALDFDLLGNSQETAAQDAQAAMKAQKIEELGKTRRTMLTIHQAMGFATLAALLATDIVGQLNYSDLYGGGGGTGRYEKYHLGLSLTTTALFTTTGLLALFAPQPFPHRLTFDASVVHRIFMAIATLGMLTEVGLGFFTASQPGKALQPALAGAHQIIGYTTLGAMSVGTVSLFF